MQPNATDSSQPTSSIRKSHSPSKYKKVLDGRKQPIRGLWERNGKYVARINVEDEAGMKHNRWVPLAGVTTVPQAQEKLKTLHVDRIRNELPVLKQTPKFAEYADRYLAYFDTVKDARRPGTLSKERGVIAKWKEHMGGLRLDKIRRVHINSFIQKRQADGISSRSVNIDIIVLRNVLKRAVDDDWLKVLPTQNLRPLKHTTPTRELVTMAEIKRICEVGIKVSKNGEQFADYIRLMAYCGARRDEAPTRPMT